METNQFKAIVIGASAGGIETLGQILPRLPKTYPLPIIIVLHIPSDQPSLLAAVFRPKTELRVKDADEKEAILPGTIYFAPPGYHLLIERDQTFSLSNEDPVHYARPSIDVLFESAAAAFNGHLLGVLLTGSNQDGAEGLRQIQLAGGLAVIQDPATARARSMPEAGIASTAALPEHILSPGAIADRLLGLR